VGTKPAALACLLAVGAIGCGTADRERDVTAVTERFHAALADGDGEAACAELNEETASKLESQEEKPCEEAILELGLPEGAAVTEARVESRSALARLDEGGAAFLDEGAAGWKVSAAGCERGAPSRPYDCTLEG
jgi:hypothetical protein